MTNRVLAVLERRWAGWPASVAGVVAVAGVVVVDAAAAAAAVAGSCWPATHARH